MLPGLVGHCGGVAVADDIQMIFQCPALHPLGQQYALLFSMDTNTVSCMRSFFAQQYHMQVLNFVPSCLDVFQM